MIVYHGSFMTVKKPDIEHSFRQLDFGKGFYVTGNYEQAKNWARRKVLIMGKGSPIINIYKMNETGCSGRQVLTKNPYAFII